MFNEKAQSVIDVAKDLAYAAALSDLTLPALVAAMASRADAAVLLAEAMESSPDRLRDAAPPFPRPVSCPRKLTLAPSLRDTLTIAKQLAEEIPDKSHPGLISLRHLAAALASSRDVGALLDLENPPREAVKRTLAHWYEADSQAPRLDELTTRMRQMRTELLSKVFGQDHAVEAFIEGLFNAEVVAAADRDRRTPRTVFVFAGPPGVGKTYLAELGAGRLGRPFRRYDMSAYSNNLQAEALVGMNRSYHGAHGGTLTEFVEKNPTAVLLFDEIEKAHPVTIHLFLQVLDAGQLEDKFHERNVVFKDTTIIFTTNAGRRLYDRPNESGLLGSSDHFHRRTVLDAIETETNPLTGAPFFPPAICSRMATGYPILFNYLKINELEKVVSAELERMATLLERQYYKRLTFAEPVPICLVLREGGRADARILRAQAENFVKSELFKFCQLFHADRLEDVLEPVESIRFGLEADGERLAADVRALLQPIEVPRVLFVAPCELSESYRSHISEVRWWVATNAEEALEVLATEEIDLVLLDLWMGAAPQSAQLREFDHLPASASGLDAGQELLRRIRDRCPEVPVYLLSIETAIPSGLPSIDDALFLACMRSGGARGLFRTKFRSANGADWEQQRLQTATALVDMCRRLSRERGAALIGRERKVLACETAPRLDRERRAMHIDLCNLRLTRSVAASDIGEVLEEVERPRTRFSDVIGATAAKDELRFFVEFLKNPRRFRNLGLATPRGVLLHGPPGTGKTMLARAMAGESDVAFLSSSASGFVTIWQGSGPQNIRNLFARARRYAPSIVFIDEIDAIGKPRVGSMGSGDAGESTLNALLTEMDGFSGPSPTRPVFVLAATNFRIDGEGETIGRGGRQLDPALVRRFARTILVDLPERASRLEYLEKRLKDRRSSTVTAACRAQIAERTPGMTIAQLETVIETAARDAARAGGVLTDAILEAALETTRFGEVKPVDPAMRERTARHEAGHTVLYWLAGFWPVYVTVVSRGHFGGYMAPDPDEVEGRSARTRSQLQAEIRVALGGRAAEQLYYGAEEGLSSGASQDLEMATTTARAMVCRYGMVEEFGLLVTPELLRFEGALSSPMYLRINEAAGKILKEEMLRTAAELERHRPQLDAVSHALLERERLSADDLKALLKPA